MRHLNSKIIILLDFKSGGRDELYAVTRLFIATIVYYQSFRLWRCRRLSLSTMITMFWFLLLRSSAVRLYSKISNIHWLYGWNDGNRQAHTSTHRRGLFRGVQLRPLLTLIIQVPSATARRAFEAEFTGTDRLHRNTTVSRFFPSRHHESRLRCRRPAFHGWHGADGSVARCVHVVVAHCGPSSG